MEAVSPCGKALHPQTALVLGKVRGLHCGGGILSTQGCPAFGRFSSSFTEHELLQPKGEGEDNPTCSGTISEVLVTGLSVRDLTRHYQCGPGKREPH